jgi:hypothetical protein
MQVVYESKNKRVSRDQFVNIRNTSWMDEDNGDGILLVEYQC